MLYVKTADVARWCSVDHTTVNRWVASGKLVEGPRTPGGHRRFAVADVRTFLVAHGYAVPQELAEANAS